MTTCLRSNKLRALIIMIAFIFAAALLYGCIQESSPPGGQAVKSQLSAARPAEKAAPEGDLLAEGASPVRETMHLLPRNRRKRTAGAAEGRHCNALS